MPAAGLRLEAQVLQLWSNQGLPIAITFYKACNWTAFPWCFPLLLCFATSYQRNQFFVYGKYCFQKTNYIIYLMYKENGHLKYCHNIKDRYKMIINCLPWHSLFRKFWSQVFRNFIRRRTNQWCLRYLKLSIFLSFIIFLSFVGLVIITYLMNSSFSNFLSWRFHACTIREKKKNLAAIIS